MLPILSQLSDDALGEVQVGHLDILDSPETPKKYGITAGPYMVVFRDGEVAARHEGSATRAQLEALLEEAKRADVGGDDDDEDTGWSLFNWLPW
jgi:thioredoxin 1